MNFTHSPWFGWAFWLFTLILNCPSFGEELPTAKPEDVGVCSSKVEELSTFMQSLVDQGKIPGGVTMMARHGKVIHLKAVGMADREEKRPMTTDAIFRIASMTKPITSVAIMMLWEQGKLDLDDPVSKYIPEFKNPRVLVSVDSFVAEPARREITIRHLLTHTSGLGYPQTKAIGPLYVDNDIPCGCVTASVTLEDNMKNLARMPLLFNPGEQWEYGMSADVLGRVVEVVSEVTLDRYLEQKIFTTLGMKDTTFKVSAAQRDRLAAAHVPVDHGIRKLNDGEIVKYGPEPISGDYPYHPSHRYLSGGGGLCSTPADYMRFCQMLLNGGELGRTRLLREGTVELMRTNHIGDLMIPGLPDKFGFGFCVYPDSQEFHQQLRGAYAWFGYWSTSFRISPRGDWSIVTMAQCGWGSDTPQWFAQYEKIAAEAVTD